MARPTKYATPICIGLSVLALIGIVLGFVFDSPLTTAGLLVPTVAYEAYRTEGDSTRWASWVMVVLLVAVLITNVFDIEFDLREVVGSDVIRQGDNEVPLGDLTVVFPAAMTVLAVVLWQRTRGVYTRWLAAIIAVTSLVILHLSAPEAVGDLLDSITSS